MRIPQRSSNRWLTGLSSACLVATLAAVPAVASASGSPSVESRAAGKSSLDARGKPLKDYRRLTVSTSQARFDEGVDNQGWWAKKDRNFDENDNYAVGECKDCESSSLTRNFFTFKLPKVEGKVVAARLVVRRYRAYGNATETLDLYDVRTPARTLNHNQGRDVKIYRDLGRGARYGRFRVATQNADPHSLVGFWLNQAAISDINAASGRYFSVGGTLASAKASDRHSDELFAFSENKGHGLQELRLFIKPPPA